MFIVVTLNESQKSREVRHVTIDSQANDFRRIDHQAPMYNPGTRIIN